MCLPPRKTPPKMHDVQGPKSGGAGISKYRVVTFEKSYLEKWGIFCYLNSKFSPITLTRRDITLKCRMIEVAYDDIIDVSMNKSLLMIISFSNKGHYREN